MPLRIDFDISAFNDSMDKLEKRSATGVIGVLQRMADSLLLLSRQEVPHDLGVLQGSGHTYQDGNDYAVAYNTEYATFQHEGHRADGSHVIRNYGKGRKGKYLEDPLKMNMSKWEQIANEEFSKLLKGNI